MYQWAFEHGKNVKINLTFTSESGDKMKIIIKVDINAETLREAQNKIKAALMVLNEIKDVNEFEVLI